MEVTNVFLVFFLCRYRRFFFPSTAYYYGTVLLVPASLGIVLLAIRGSYYAFTTYGKLKSHFWTYLYGFSGLLIPASLSIVLTISEGGFIDNTSAGLSLNYVALFFSPLTWSIVTLSLTSVLYISAVFLTWYANEAKDEQATALLRKYALIWAFPAIITAGGIIVELRVHNELHFQNMLNVWWMFLLSGILFAATVYLIWKKKKLRGCFFVINWSILDRVLCLWYLPLSIFALSLPNYCRGLYK